MSSNVNDNSKLSALYRYPNSLYQPTAEFRWSIPLCTANRPCSRPCCTSTATQHAVQLAVCGSSCVIGGYDVSCQQCSCTFFKAFKLPCRHIFNYREVCRVDVTDLSHVTDRWLRHQHTSAHSTGSFSVVYVANSSSCQARSLEQKYRGAKLVVECRQHHQWHGNVRHSRILLQIAGSEKAAGVVTCWQTSSRWKCWEWCGGRNRWHSRSPCRGSPGLWHRWSSRNCHSNKW